MMGIEGKWECDDSIPNDCLSCGELYNGIYYAKIKVGGIYVTINVCEKCKGKAQKGDK